MKGAKEIADIILEASMNKGEPERTEYIKHIVNLLMMGAGLEEIKNIRLNAGGGACCY